MESMVVYAQGSRFIDDLGDAKAALGDLRATGFRAGDMKSLMARKEPPELTLMVTNMVS
jgi:hypothetical protein